MSYNKSKYSKYSNKSYNNTHKYSNESVINDNNNNVPITDKSNLWSSRARINVNSTKNKVDDGSDIKLNHEYILWCHDIYDKNWKKNSYKQLCKINNVSDFWRLFNNFNTLGMRFNHYFFMKNNIFPTWEDINNRNGGSCSFRIEIDECYEIWEELNIRMVCDLLHDDKDINGISISPKNNWAIIKIWNKNKNYDLSVCLPDDLLKKYSNLSIKYKIHEPEY